jgi:hypothetical protein
MSLRFPRELAAAADFDAVSHELTQSQKRLDNGLHTEAVLRLGRATEACVYAAAGTFGIDATVGIREFSDLHGKLTGTESLIIKSRSPGDVDRHLDELTKQLKTVVESMRDDFSKTNGEAGQSPRGSLRLLKDVHLNATKPHTRRKAKRTHTLLRQVMGARNDSAHAAPDGQIREVAANDVDRLLDDGAELITSIIMFALGQRSNAAGHK